MHDAFARERHLKTGMGKRYLKNKLTRFLSLTGQATTELAIMGTIVIMVLAYLLQQGFIYNCRQSLEMYTFRKALQLSRGENRGIGLQVIRDVIVPSFFSGLNRQRLVSVASIDHNPFILYNPSENDPEHVESRQLIQINEAMIRSGYFFEVPPTKIKVKVKEKKNEEVPKPKWMWTSSSIRNLDSPTEKNIKTTPRISRYNYVTKISEDGSGKTTSKILRSEDKIPFIITFENKQEIIDKYMKDDKIESVEVDESTIPKDVNLILDETVERTRNVWTPR